MVLMLGVLLLVAFDIPESWMPKWLYEEWPLVTLPPTTLGFLAFSPANYSDWKAGKLELNFLPLVLAIQFFAWWICSVVLVCMANIRFRVVTGRTSGLPNPPCSLPEASAPLPVAAKQPGNALTRDRQRSAGSALLNSTSAAEADDPNTYEEIIVQNRTRRLTSRFLFFLPLLAVLAWYGYSHFAAEKSLDEILAQINQSDPGWRLEDIEANREVIPEKENSALVVQEVRERLLGGWEDQALTLTLQDLAPEKQLNDRQTQKIEEMLKKIQEPLALARRLADMPRGRTPIHYSDDGISTLLPNTQNARSAANLLRFDALLRSQKKDANGALDSVRGILNAARSVGDEPTLISVLVRIAIRNMAMAELERALAQGEPSEHSMQVFQDLLEDEEKVPLLLIGLRGERGILDRFFESIQNGKTNTNAKMVRGFWGGSPEVIFMGGSLKGQRAALLEIMTEEVEAANLPVEQQEAEFLRIEQTVHQKPLVIRLILPGGFRIEQSYWRSQAQLRTAIVALAVERFRRELGRWPKSIAELVPGKLKQIYIDPYDGKPLRYRRNKDGVVIYSVGPDKVDDGGTLNRSNTGTPGPDIGIQLWDPDKRRQPAPPPKPSEEEGAATRAED
jgi:hypothetical protein